MLVKEGAEPRSAPARQDADRDAQPMRRGSSFSSQLDMASGLSGEGSRLHELVLLSPMLLLQGQQFQGLRLAHESPEILQSMSLLA